MYKLYKVRKKYKFKESFDFLSYPMVINDLEIAIVNEKIIKIFVKESINDTFNKLMINVVNFIENDDSSEDDEVLLLSQISNLNNLIFNLYKDYFTKAELNKFGRNIRLLVNEIKLKIKNKEKKVVKNSSRRSR